MTELSEGPSGATRTYTITDVAGQAPIGLDDCVGATTLSVRGDEREYQLRGAGRREGPAVEFHERESSSASPETSVWKIVEHSEGHLVAKPPAS